jgi:hypothetical protein
MPAKRDPDQGCTPQELEFIEWLVNPERQGNQKEWAEAHGIHVNTLFNWKKQKFFRDEWEKRAAELNVSPERTQAVINAIFKAAKNGDTSAAKLYLEYINKFTPTQRVITEDKGVQSLTDEELAAQAEENIRHLRVAE